MLHLPKCHYFRCDRLAGGERRKLHVRKFAETSLAPLRLICMSRINPPTLVQISPALLQDACARASICKPAKPFPSSVIFGLASCTSRSNRRNLQKSFRLGSVRLRLVGQADKTCKHQGRRSSLRKDCIASRLPFQSRPPKFDQRGKSLHGADRSLPLLREAYR